MRSRIWAVAIDDRRVDLGFFSTKAGADRYLATLIERYSLGKNLSLHGKQLAPDSGSWKLGLGPQVLEYAVDESIDSLPGAWMVKVDETCHMIACAFNTEHKPTRSPIHYRMGMHAICEAYGPTPHDALDRARKAMISYLGKNHSWR